jgi:type II secretory pathway pseudopilin PulG
MKNRRASLLLELVISGIVLGMAMSAAIPTLGWIARERQLTRQRQAAILEVGNLMERITLVDWNELTSRRASSFEISERLRDELVDSDLKVTVAPDDSDEGSKHVLIELNWDVVPGRPAPPVRLAAWVHRPPIEQAHAN